MKRGEELKPGFVRTKPTDYKGGKRRLIVTSLMKTEITSENEHTVPIPALNQSLCIIPDTLVLSFKFTNSNTKSWFLTNLGRTIVERLSVNIQGKEVYQCTRESMMEVYKDLWMSEEDRKNRQEFGIPNENVRKLISKDDSANKATKTDGVLDLTRSPTCVTE